MTLQTILPYLPFLAVLYALFALLQAVRHQRQGLVATLLALIALAAPLIAYFVDASARVRLIQFIQINAVIVFVASLITLLIERRNAPRDSQRDSQRDLNRSYGMLGIGLSILLVIATFALPLATSTTSAAPPAFTSTTTNTDNRDLQFALKFEF